MIDHLIPDIPRLYSAIAEWLACMIFILPFKKRFSKIKTGVIMAVMLVVQSGFMVVTECSLVSVSTSQSREALCSAAKERSGIRRSGI